VGTPSQTVGPFFGFALPFPGDADAASGDKAVRIQGQLLDGKGEPVADGLLEVWDADQFARCRTDAEGAYHFTVNKPAAPAARGGIAFAPHFNVNVFARGLLRHLVTRIYFPDEEAANAADPVLARVDPERLATLVARRDGSVLRFDVHLQGADETVFFAADYTREVKTDE
jgi:protocatechuate 3,4-dioxygenase alpha subunit